MSSGKLFAAGGADVNKVQVPPELATVICIAILLAGSLKAGFQPNTRKVEYANREWLLSNTIHEAEASLAEYNSQTPPNPASLNPIAKILNEAIKEATKPLKIVAFALDDGFVDVADGAGAAAPEDGENFQFGVGGAGSVSGIDTKKVIRESYIKRENRMLRQIRFASRRIPSAIHIRNWVW
jgi:hypothetical protein